MQGGGRAEGWRERWQAVDARVQKLLDRAVAHRLFPLIFWALIIAALLHAFDRRPRNHWHYAKDFWRFSWEIEFLKRALPGELYRRSGLPLEQEILFSIALGFMLLLVIVLLFVARRLLQVSGWAPGIVVLVFIVYTHSAFLPARFNDFGRFDVLLLLLALSLLPLMAGGRERAFIPAAAAVGLVSLLVHEAAFLMFLPGVMACWIALSPTSGRIRISCALLLGLGVMGLWIKQAGSLTPELMDEHLALLARADAGLQGGINSWVFIVYRPDGLIENVAHTLRVAHDPARYLHHLLFAAASIPMALLVWRARFLGPHLGERRTRFWIAALVLLPLALYPLGHDHFRWWNMALSNFFLLLLVTATYRPALRHGLDRFMRRQLPLAVAVCLISLVLGAMGFTYSFRIAYGLN